VEAGAIHDGVGRGGGEAQVAEAVGAAGGGGGVAFDQKFTAATGGGRRVGALDKGVVAGRERMLVEAGGMDDRGCEEEAEAG
jgi:hypothetical protein